MLIFLLCVFGLFSSTLQQNDGDLTDLIAQIYNTTTAKNVPSDKTNPRDSSGDSGSSGGSGGSGGSTGSCTCVPYYLCQNGSVNTNGEGIIDIRLNDGPCNSYIEVCCNEGNEVDEPITPPPPERVGCGYRNPDGVGFRIKGQKDGEAQFGEFPWMVAVLQEEQVDGYNKKLNVYKCGGALIHPQVVLTAAHCVNVQKKQFKIRAGEWDTQTSKELFPHQDRDVQSIVIHPKFYGGALHNDVALLFLDSAVNLAPNVGMVCLPPQGLVTQNVRCFASGWGKDNFNKTGKYQVILKRVDLPIVPRSDCQQKLRTTRLGKYFELHESFVCAGGEPELDTCKGDGGSPLVCPIQGQNLRYYHTGIVAWGIGCGENNVPGVYVNVAHFRRWIDDQMTAKNLDTSVYQA